jgi:hypothetical protein
MSKNSLPPERNILVMGGLIGVSTIIVQQFFAPGSCALLGNCSGLITFSILSFAVGLPTMAFGILFTRLSLEHRTDIDRSGTIIIVIGYVGLSLGLITAFWRLYPLAGLLLIIFSIFSLFFYVYYRYRVMHSKSSQGTFSQPVSEQITSSVPPSE